MIDTKQWRMRAGDVRGPLRGQVGLGRWWVLVALVLALGVGWWAWSHHRAAQGDAQAASGAAPGKGGKRKGGGMDRPIPVRVAAVDQRDMDVLIDALGTVTPMGSATVRVRVDGLLQKVLFNEGQAVKAGQVLAEIDPKPYEVALAQAQGQFLRDKALLDNARLDLKRYADMVRQNAASQQQLDTQQALVSQYEGTLKLDQAAVDSAKLQLGYTKVTAPASGRIGLRQVDPGNMVKGTDTNGLVVINQIQPISVVFAIPQEQLSAVLARKGGQGLPVQARDRSGAQLLAAGQLQSIDNQVDTTTGTVKLKARFANDDNALFPNQFVNARLQVDRLKAVPTVPEAAVLRGTKGSFVYVAADGQAKMTLIKVGPRADGRVAVTDGLQMGQQVVIDGTDRLEDGSKVDIVKDDPMAAASGASAASGAHRRQRPQ